MGFYLVFTCICIWVSSRSCFRCIGYQPVQYIKWFLCSKNKKILEWCRFKCKHKSLSIGWIFWCIKNACMLARTAYRYRPWQESLSTPTANGCGLWLQLSFSEAQYISVWSTTGKEDFKSFWIRHISRIIIMNNRRSCRWLTYTKPVKTIGPKVWTD